MIKTYRDDWGIPHLRASDALQLAFGQGENAASDRAWQIEVERHRSQGTTAASLGADAVPGVPGIAHFGHTGTVAWAITNAMSDYHDLYRERLRRVDGRIEALGPDGWRQADHHRENIEVAEGEPVGIDVIETERGPVIIDCLEDAPGPDTEPTVVAGGISLRYPPRVTADLGFDVIPALLRARTVQDVDRALDRWIEPVNVVHAADSSGGLLHRVAGHVPTRHRDNWLRFVPAWQQGHDWHGRHDTPRAEVDGIAVMANARGLRRPARRGVRAAAPGRPYRSTAAGVAGLDGPGPDGHPHGHSSQGGGAAPGTGGAAG